MLCSALQSTGVQPVNAHKGCTQLKLSWEAAEANSLFPERNKLFSEIDSE